MRPAEFTHNIRSAFTALIDLGLTSWDRVGSFSGKEVDSEFRKVAMNPKIGYHSLYLIGLKRRAYNFTLCDFSYFQFWTDCSKHSQRLRYSYMPNPFNAPHADVDRMELDPESYEIYFQLLEEVEPQNAVPPIRYDLALNDHIAVLHPASHLTIGAHSDNRWPVARVLTPKLFCLFICKQYYTNNWRTLGKTEDIGSGFNNIFDLSLAEEKRACIKLDDDHFTEHERLHLYFE